MDRTKNNGGNGGSGGRVLPWVPTSILCVLVLVPVYSCATAVQPTVARDPSTSGEMQPLEIGWRWVYVIEDGTLCRREIVGRENVGRFDCRVMTESAGSARNRYWLRSDRDGLKLFRADDGLTRQDMEDPLVWIKYPARAGESWEYDARHGVVDIRCRGQYEADERIRVPAGEFQCARIKTVGSCDRTPVFEKVEWYARGIGLVRMQVKYFDGREAAMNLKEISR